MFESIFLNSWHLKMLAEAADDLSSVIDSFADFLGTISDVPII